MVEVKSIIIPHSPYFAVENMIKKTFSQIEIPKTVLTMSGNHTGEGERAAIKGEEELASLLMKYCPLLRKDELSFLNESPSPCPLPSREGEITSLLFVPASFERSQRIAADIINALQCYQKPTLIVISSNLNHFEPTEKKDHSAIEKIKTLDSFGFFEVTQKHKMSICGTTPIVIALEIARSFGSTKAHLIEYSKNFDIGHGSFLIN